jgi:lipoyl(octanoyl) transferase
VDGLTGVWTADGQRKLAAIGVKIAGGVAYHGFAINVSTDLSMYDAIVPCGITDREVTSIVAELPDSVNIMTVKAVADIVAQQFCGVFGFRSETVNAAGALEATECNTTSS